MLEISHTAPVWADRLLVCLFWHKIHWKGRKYLTASSDSRLPHWRQEDFSLFFFQLWASLPKTCCVNMSDCFLWASCFKTFFGCLWMSFQSVRRWCYSNKYMYVFYQLPWIKTIRKQQFERLQWTESVLWDGVWSWHSFSLPLASFLPNDSVLVAMHDTELSCALIG